MKYILIVPLLSPIIYLTFTKYGLSVSPDSVYYLMGAEHIRQGIGFVIKYPDGSTEPITHWPFMYSLILALIPPKVLNGLCYALSILIFGAIIFRMTSSVVLSVLSQLVFMTSPVVLKYTISVWSENLFNCLFLVLVFLLLQQNPRYTVLALLSIAMVFTRYVGLFLSLAFVFIFKRKGIFIALIVVLSFLAYRAFLGFMGGKSTYEGLGMYLDELPDLLRKTFDTLIFFFSGGFAPMILLFTVGLLGVLFVRKHFGDRDRFALKTLSVLVSSFLIFLMFAKITVFRNLSIDERMLSPIYPLLVALIILLSRGSFKLSIYMLSVMLISNLISLKNLYEHVQTRSPSILGYNSPYFQSMSILQVLDTLDMSAYVYTNVPDLLWYVKGRYSRMLPLAYDPRTGKLNVELLDELRNLKSKDGKAYVLYLNGFRGYTARVEHVLRVFPNSKVFRFREGYLVELKP